jgi:hypothetical protein
MFPTPKISLKGTHFASMEAIKMKVMAELRKIPNEAFCWCFQQWKDKWSMLVCLYVGGEGGKSPTLMFIR